MPIQNFLAHLTFFFFLLPKNFEVNLMKYPPLYTFTTE
jgi:hypothetical protein